MITITVAGTKSYLYAWPQCVRAIAVAAAHHTDAHFIFATDESKEGKEAGELAQRELPDGWKVSVLNLPIKDDQSTKYKEEAQIRIAALQGACFSFSRKIRSDACWVVESDTIVSADSLRVLEWTLAMPTADGSPHYDIAAATYPNGLFLGGFGTPQNQIAEDFLPSDKEVRRIGRLRERVKKCPPDGNVWEVNAKHGWRRRGWMESAYPSIGRGAIVPSDWCGLGCTLLSKRALLHSDFTGYEGKGTQDLFLCWNRWYPAGLKIACVPHIVCDHIKRKSPDHPADVPEIIHYRAYHETEGECRGHLRVREQAFVQV